MSRTPPIREVAEQGLGPKALEAYGEADLITTLGDGVQSFIGLISAVLSLPHKLMLIDEPEAFLHPPLARRLGSSLINITTSRNGSMVVSTHSADFLLGCLESSVKTVTVVRLTHEKNVATARMLSPQSLETIIRNPLIRSTGVLRALFHHGAIVTESDTDRAFYDEINRRLLEADRGMEDILFLNAQNWQTVPTIVEPLRQIGIPAAGIVDLDMIRKPGTEFTKFLEAFQLPESCWNHLRNERAHLMQLFERLNQQKQQDVSNPIKTPGIDALNPADKQRAKAFLGDLAQYGLFLVPSGEVESWLRRRNIPGHGSEWLIKMFSSIGQSETDTGYAHPAKDDVWRFLDGIDQWMSNPRRLGVA